MNLNYEYAILGGCKAQKGYVHTLAIFLFTEGRKEIVLF